MEFFGRTTNVDFVKRRRIAYGVSAAMLAAAVLAMIVRGLNLGLDFTGGSVVEVAYRDPVEVSRVREALAAAGFERTVVQHFGSTRELMIRVPPEPGADRATRAERVLDALGTLAPERPELRRVEFVGPQVGEDLAEQGLLALLLSIGGIMIYIWWRFEGRLALGAVAATIHDPLVILGFFAITGMEFDITVLAATLAVIGYSVNDTIVVFDRIRDNMRLMRSASVAEVINRSVNQTMSRTILTSGTTLLVVIGLLAAGGPLLRGFSTALLLGIVVGTYSSIFVAAASALDMGLDRKDFLPVVKEGADGNPPS